MRMISERVLAAIKARFPAGTRVELIHMDDPYNRKLVPGCKGTVLCVDDMGTIHVSWDIGSSLGVVYGKDSCRITDQYEKVPEKGL